MALFEDWLKTEAENPDSHMSNAREKYIEFQRNKTDRQKLVTEAQPFNPLEGRKVNESWEALRLQAQGVVNSRVPEQLRCSFLLEKH